MSDMRLSCRDGIKGPLNETRVLFFVERVCLFCHDKLKHIGHLVTPAFYFFPIAPSS